ncbi:relaxase/mobilization nuclease domain-containing protein [Chryseobacterium sp. TY4]
MIGKAKACSGGGALNNYVLNEGKGYELDRNMLCGSTPKEILDEMSGIQNMNSTATNKTFSLVISPDPIDGKNISDKELKEITRDFMNRLGINPKEQQFIAFVHTEKEHKHIHIIANRVRENGTLIPDNHIGKKAQYAAHEIAQERGLVSAKQKQFDNINSLEIANTNSKGLKKEILNKHNQVMNSRPRYFENYQKQMLKLGIDVQPTINKQGQVQGHRLIDIASGTSFKASEINKNLGLKNMLEGGMKFSNPIQLTKPLEIAANIGLAVAKTIVKSMIKQASHGIGF